jgi:hypothetical protein
MTLVFVHRSVDERDNPILAPTIPRETRHERKKERRKDRRKKIRQEKGHETQYTVVGAREALADLISRSNQYKPAEPAFDGVSSILSR